jgi:predicted nuclease with TOPRIM domain
VAEGGGTQGEQVARLEQENLEQREIIAELRAELSRVEQQRTEQEETNATLRATIHSLNATVLAKEKKKLDHKMFLLNREIFKLSSDEHICTFKTAVVYQHPHIDIILCMLDSLCFGPRHRDNNIQVDQG